MDMNILNYIYENNNDLQYNKTKSDIEYISKFISVLHSVWESIENKYQVVICNNLEFIIFKNIEDCGQNGFKISPYTQVNKASKKCFIEFNPLINNNLAKNYEMETIIFLLFHEFGHVYYKHPVKWQFSNSKIIKLGYMIENDYINDKAEPEAFMITEYKWKIYPHGNDIDRLCVYRNMKASYPSFKKIANPILKKH